MSGYLKRDIPAADEVARAITNEITVTQPVDLDQIEIDTNLNNAKVGITPTQAAEVATNTLKVSNIPQLSDALVAQDIADIQNLSGVNTGDQDLSTYALISHVKNDLVSLDTDRPLSANQGKVLKGLIDTINSLLTSDTSTLDDLQKIVDYIKLNRSTLDALSIPSISGLQAALDAKVDDGQVLTNVPAGAVFTDTDTIYDDTVIAAAVALNTNKETNVDHPLVETAVPVGAVFTDTETTTSISVTTNILTYTDELGVTTDIDLSLYLDDTNLARIASGSLNGVTGIATFTRDDTSTFTVDLSALLDDTSVTVNNTLTSTSTSEALSAAQGKVLKDVQDTQDIEIGLNTNKVGLTTGQVTILGNTSGVNTGDQDISGIGINATAIALNTGKISYPSADSSKLDLIEANATADQTDIEIEAAYNNQVAVVTQVDAEAGISTDVTRWTAERVAQAVEANSTSFILQVASEAVLSAIPITAIVDNTPVWVMSLGRLLYFNASESLDKAGYISTPTTGKWVPTESTGVASTTFTDESSITASNAFHDEVVILEGATDCTFTLPTTLEEGTTFTVVNKLASNIVTFSSTSVSSVNSFLILAAPGSGCTCVLIGSTWNLFGPLS